MAKRRSTADRILDTALTLAQGSAWERVTLGAVADAMGIGLDDIRAHYAQKDDLVEAWFDRADSAMLNAASGAGFADLPPGERVAQALLAWLDALAPYRVVTGQMLWYKLEPGHIHLQALGIMRISRTVQWLREAARLDSTHLMRIVEEGALTTTYLLTFARWLRDGSDNTQATREFLEHLLRRGEPLMRGVGAVLQPRRRDAQ